MADAPIQLGADIPLPEDSVTVIDVEAHEIRTDGTLSKTHNVRRVFHNEANTIDASPLTIMVPSAEPRCRRSLGDLGAGCNHDRERV